MKRNLILGSSVGLLGALFLVGCGQPAPVPPAPSVATPPVNVVVNADAGVEVTQSTDLARLPKLYASAASKYGGPRRDPFALQSDERAFDQAQLSERVLGGAGFYPLGYQEPEDREATVEIEPQPARRLLGIIIGDAVVAIIDMGDGRTELIRPGTKIPNSEWTVVSIDSDKAVLRRSGQKLPREITVKLEPPSALGGGAPAGGGPGAGGPGGPPGPGAGGPPMGGGRPGAAGPGGGKGGVGEF